MVRLGDCRSWARICAARGHVLMICLCFNVIPVLSSVSFLWIGTAFFLLQMTKFLFQVDRTVSQPGSTFWRAWRLCNADEEDGWRATNPGNSKQLLWFLVLTKCLLCMDSSPAITSIGLHGTEWIVQKSWVCVSHASCYCVCLWYPRLTHFLAAVYDRSLPLMFSLVFPHAQVYIRWPSTSDISLSLITSERKRSRMPVGLQAWVANQLGRKSVGELFYAWIIFAQSN
jgi:hypothetical protein